MKITINEWGFILMCFIVIEVLTWTACCDMRTQEKIILPIITMVVMIAIMIACKMMGA